ncbi:hypothetical protein [Paludisphaera rhizosphaerae]|uniref:hypothetical protein n=1 Tax=Paludisphaera rhizosphaerae TaxID=2711216 RepID=UPI0013ECDABF|nr:hypothetical protein [Paludisphaera rhizosphaerae]
MSGEARDSIPFRLAAMALGFVVVVLVGASNLELDRSWFLRKSPAERDRLRESLRRFDMMLNNDEQRAVRSIDERLNNLPEDERDDYLIVLRRYHNWLKSLPERDRDALLAMPADVRLKRIQELTAKYPPPGGGSNASLDFIQIGGTGAFEVAALCKVWLSLNATERARIDGMTAGVRKDELIKKRKELKIPRELKPADFDEDHWIAETETRFRELRGLNVGPKDWLSKIESKLEQAEANTPENTTRPRPYLHRFAVNLYVQEHKLQHPVDPTRLAQFFDAVPPWIRSTFVPFSGDDVRRRLSILYRILYPYPEEFRALGPPQPVQPPKPSTPATQSKAAPTPPPAPKPANQAPF